MSGTLQFVPQILPPSKGNTSAVRRQIQKQLKDVSVDLQIKGGPQASRAIGDITSETKKATKATQSFADAIGLSGRRFLAYTSAVAIVGRLSSAISKATRDAIKFEREFVKLAQVFDTGITNIKGLEREISSLSQEFGISANIIAKTSLVLAQSGLTAKETAKAMRAIAKADVSPTFGNIASTAEGAVAIMAQFRQGAEKLEQQLSSINAVAKRFAVESQDVIEAIRRSGGAFKAAGGTFREFIALFTAVRSTTRESAETIATGFRTIFARIQRPKTIEYFKELGIQLKDAKGYFVGPYEAVKRLSDGLERLGIRAGQVKFAEVVEQLGGIRQVSRVIPLLGEWKKAELALQVAKAGGKSLDEDYAKAQETVAFRIDQVKQQFSALIREFTDTGTFKGVVKLMLGMATALMQVVKSLKPLLPMIAVLGAMKLGSIFGGALKKGVSPGTALQINKGGKVPGFARGGPVPGTGNRDTVPAMLEPGEFVIRKSAVQAFGADRLASINKYTNGGNAEEATITKRKKMVKGQKEVEGEEKFDPYAENSKIKVPGLADKAERASITGAELTKKSKTDSKLSPAAIGGMRGILVEKATNYKLSPDTFPDLNKRQAERFLKVKGYDGAEIKYANNPSTRASYYAGYFTETDGNNPHVGKKIPMVYAYANGGMAGFKPSLTGRGIAPGNVGRNKQYKSQQLAYLEQQLNEGTLSKEDEDLIKSLAARLSTIQASRNRRFANRLGFAGGGSVGTDTVPALLTPGEFVINRKSAEAFGYGNLEKINKYAKGGTVQKFKKGGKTVKQGGVDWAVNNKEMMKDLMEALAEVDAAIEQSAQAAEERRKREKEHTEELLERNRVKKRAHDSARELMEPEKSPQVEQPKEKVKFDEFGARSANRDEVKRQRQAKKEAAESSTYALQKPGPRVRPAGPNPPGYDPKTPKGVGFDPKYLELIVQEMEEANKKSEDKEEEQKYSYVPTKELQESRRALDDVSLSASNVKDGLAGLSGGLSATIFALSDAENELAQGLVAFAAGLKTVGVARDAAVTRLGQSGADGLQKSRNEAVASAKIKAGYSADDTKVDKKTSKSLDKVNAKYDKKLAILNRLMKVYTLVATAFDVFGSAALAYSSVLQTAAEKEKEKAIEAGDVDTAGAAAGEAYDRAADAQAMQGGMNIGGAVGAAIGAIFGPVGAIVGGLIGSFAGLVAAFTMGGDLLQMFWDTIAAMVPPVVSVINAIITAFNFLLKGVSAVAGWFGADIDLEIPTIGPEIVGKILDLIPDPEMTRSIEVANARHAASIVKATKAISDSSQKFESDMGALSLAGTSEGIEAAYNNLVKGLQKTSTITFQATQGKGGLDTKKEGLTTAGIADRISSLTKKIEANEQLLGSGELNTGNAFAHRSLRGDTDAMENDLKNLQEALKKSVEATNQSAQQLKAGFDAARSRGGLSRMTSDLNQGQSIAVNKDSGLVMTESLQKGGKLQQLFVNLVATGKTQKQAQVELTKVIFGSKGAFEQFNKNLKSSAAAFGPMLKKLAFGTEGEKRSADKAVRGAAAITSGQVNINDLNDETKGQSLDFLAGMLNKGVTSFAGGDIRESLRANAAKELGPGFEEMEKGQQDALLDAMFGIDETPQKQLKEAQNQTKILLAISKGIPVEGLDKEGNVTTNAKAVVKDPMGNTIEPTVVDAKVKKQTLQTIKPTAKRSESDSLENYGEPVKRKKNRMAGAARLMSVMAGAFSGDTGPGSDYQKNIELAKANKAKDAEFERRSAMTGEQRYIEDEHKRRGTPSGLETVRKVNDEYMGGVGRLAGGAANLVGKGVSAFTEPLSQGFNSARGITPGTEENVAAGNAPADLMLTASNNILEAATIMPKEIELRLNDMSVNLNVNGAEILNALMPEVRKVIVASSIESLVEFESIKDQNNTPGSYKNSKASQSVQPA